MCKKEQFKFGQWYQVICRGYLHNKIGIYTSVTDRSENFQVALIFEDIKGERWFDPIELRFVQDVHKPIIGQEDA